MGSDLEAYEGRAIKELFEPTTGDTPTDEILRAIRDEEREHAKQLHKLRTDLSS